MARLRGVCASSSSCIRMARQYISYAAACRLLMTWLLAFLSLLAYAAVWLATLRARPDKAGGDGADGGRPARDELVYAKLRNRYLGVYALATFGDWIQGGYLYALYAEYGYSMGGIAALFVVGYGAAATVGTYVGAVGDVHGHRTNCMA